MADPPASERELVSLWKIYILSLLGALFVDYGFGGDSASEVKVFLEREGLLKGKADLKTLVRRSLDYVKSFFREPESVEYGVKVDPYTQHFSGFTRKITFAQPSAEHEKAGAKTVDALLELANRALGEQRDPCVSWILFDRLDVAFSGSQAGLVPRLALRCRWRLPRRPAKRSVQVSLEWILTEARTAGLLVNETRADDVLGISADSHYQRASVQFPLHNSLAGGWVLAEFIPKPYYDYATDRRTWRANLFRRRVMPRGALVDGSAHLRGRPYTDRLPPNAQRVD